MKSYLGKIRVRINELKSIVIRLDSRTNDILNLLSSLEFDAKSNRHLSQLSFALQLCKALSEVTKIKILENGKITKESERIVKKYNDVDYYEEY